MTEIVVHAATMTGLKNTVLIELTKLPKYKFYEMSISYIIQSNQIHRKRRQVPVLWGCIKEEMHSAVEYA